MKVVEQIKEPIYEEMELFEEKFTASMSSKVALLNRITHFIVNRKGKQMRPMFVFLTAKMLNQGKVNERTYRGAAVIELIHTASLVHDDVVDDSNLRRGFFSVNALEISEGELLQIEKARKLDITEEVYYNIIRQKTATLLAACCAMGARTVQENDAIVEKMRLFGEYIGMAFQIKDDLFDYGETAIGKPTGIDIKEQKMTLPLIYTLNNVSTAEKNWLIQSVKRYNRDKKRVKQVIEKVKAAGGLIYAEEKMEDFRKKAMNLLLEFPQDAYRDALEQMVNYVISRKQ